MEMNSAWANGDEDGMLLAGLHRCAESPPNRVLEMLLAYQAAGGLESWQHAVFMEPREQRAVFISICPSPEDTCASGF